MLIAIINKRTAFGITGNKCGTENKYQTSLISNCGHMIYICAEGTIADAIDMEYINDSEAMDCYWDLVLETAKDSFSYITEAYTSNCLLEAIKAKIKNLSGVTLYFCKPRITENGNFQWPHIMWSDQNGSYDFSDDEETDLPWYRTFWY